MAHVTSQVDLTKCVTSKFQEMCTVRLNNKGMLLDAVEVILYCKG